MITAKPKNIDEYIAGFPGNIQKVLEEIRATIMKVAPGVQEKISYVMPAFTLNEASIAYFAAFKNHIGFYPAPTGNDAFRVALSGYKTGRGSIQFPLNQPMPLDLVTKMVKFRIEVNAEHIERKKKND